MRKLIWLGMLTPLLAADFKAGVARQVITPDKPIYMIGYASRNHPSEGVVQDLWLKALAIEDAKPSRTLIITMDLAAIPRPLADDVAARVQKQFGVPRDRLVLNVSHNHSGPLLWGRYPHPPLVFDLTGAEMERIKDYTNWLGDQIVAVAGRALQDLEPANLSFGHGEASFTVNRRERTPQGGIKLGVNPEGPVDHDVPVLKVATPDGKVKAVLFGYACHNTTLGGNFYKFAGDYAGYAQADLEKAHPGATALFMALCAGNQNPRPHGTLQMAQDHGAELAGAVEHALGDRMQPVRGNVQSAWLVTPLKIRAFSREELQKAAEGKNPQRVRYATSMLKDYDELSKPYPYPMQALRFGNDLTLLALGGEVVVEYALWAKRQFGASGLIVAAYSNDEMAYIPTAKMIEEGGHEGREAMFVYGHPGVWDAEIESTLYNGITTVMKKIGREPAQK